MSFIKTILNKHTLSLASNAAMPVIGMITVSLLARNLTATDFGNWILFLITFTLANLLRSGFLSTSVVKFYAGAEEQRGLSVIGATWYLGFIVTASLALISFALFLFYRGDPIVEITVKWFAFIFFSTLPSSIALWILQADQKFDKVFMLQLIWPGCFFVAIIILISLNQISFINVVYSYFISTTITSIVALLTGWAKVNAITKKNRDCVKELVNFGKFSIFTSISSYLLRSSDTFIIKFMFINPAVVGVYYLPQRLMEVIEIPLRSFIATALPTMSAAMQRNDEVTMTYVMKKYAGILTVLLIPVSLVALIGADIVIRILGGEKFVDSEAANVFRIFMCFAILLPVDRFFGITLDILNKPNFNLVKVSLMLVVNVIGDFIGIYFTHSIYGVAIASIFTFLAGVIYGYWILKKHLKFTMRDILTLGFMETKALVTGFLKKKQASNQLG